MKIQVVQAPPVIHPVEKVVIELTQAEAELLAGADWFGPKEHARAYFGEQCEMSTFAGRPANHEIATACELRDLLRSISRRVRDQMKGEPEA